MNKTLVTPKPLRTVLIADSNVEQLRELDRAFTAWGWRVIEARDGLEIQETLEEKHVDLIVSNSLLPLKDGVSVCLDLQEDEKWDRLPFILLGDEQDQLTADLSNKIDCHSYLSRPFPLPQLESIASDSLNPPVRKPVESQESKDFSALIVDDTVAIRKVLGRFLKQLELSVNEAASGREMDEVLRTDRPDIIVLDILMPEEDGMTILSRLKANPETKDIPVIMISGVGDTEVVRRALEIGAVDYLAKPFCSVRLRARIQNCLSILKLQRLETVHRQVLESSNQELEAEVQKQVQKLNRSHHGMIFALSKLAESRDPETGEHLERLQGYCRVLCESLLERGVYTETLTQDFIQDLIAASPLHDIGKVGIPDAVLLKPGRLTADEFNVMKEHSQIGADTLTAVRERYGHCSLLDMGSEIALSHHERWDGSGYPEGLSGSDIPLSARILALPDVYDALTSKRVYKDAMSHKKSRSIICEGSGSHFDPEIVAAFLDAEQQFISIRETLRRSRNTLEEQERALETILKSNEFLIVGGSEEQVRAVAQWSPAARFTTDIGAAEDLENCRLALFLSPSQELVDRTRDLWPKNSGPIKILVGEGESNHDNSFFEVSSATLEHPEFRKILNSLLLAPNAHQAHHLLTQVCQDIGSQVTRRAPKDWSSLSGYSDRKLTALVIDDSPAILKILEKFLCRLDLKVNSVLSGSEMDQALESKTPDIIILDIMLPGENGIEILSRLKKNPKTKSIPVIMVSGVGESEIVKKALEMGAIDYLTKPFCSYRLKARIRNCISSIKLFQLENAHRRTLEDANEILEAEVERQVQCLKRSHYGMIFALSKLAESRDPETGEHLERLQEYCKAICERLLEKNVYTEELTPEFMQNLYASSPLHDIGKVGIPDAVLLKPGRLSAEEFDIMKTHSEIGAETLKAVALRYDNNALLQMGVTIARSHHEKWDGSGYPEGLRGEEIHLGARILALADVYDALTSKRVYKDAFSHEKSREILTEGRGKHFDPEIVDAFLDVEERFVEIRKTFIDTAPESNRPSLAEENAA